MRSMISGSKFVMAFIAGAHALQSSSIPQEGETICTEEQTPVLTIDSLVQDVEQKSKDLGYCIKHIVERLLAGNILGTNDYGRDVLHVVCCSLDECSFGESQAVVLAELLLIKYKYNPNAKDDAGQHALMSAALANRPSLVKLLVQHGADIDHQDKFAKWTALHHAAKYGYLEVVKLLLENGANTSLKNTGGTTAWQVARQQNEHEVISIFKKHENLRKSFAVVLGLNYYTTDQIVAPKTMSNNEGLFTVDKSAILNILSFLKTKSE